MFTWSLRAERHLLFISQFTSNICYVTSNSNKVADALSRPPIPPTSPTDNDYINDIPVQEPFQPPFTSPVPTPPTPTPSTTSSTSRAAPSPGDIEGLPATRPSLTSVGDVRQVFDRSTNLPADEADEAGVDLAARQADQMTDADATKLSKLKGFSFSFVMFKDVSLL